MLFSHIVISTIPGYNEDTKEVKAEMNGCSLGYSFLDKDPVLAPSQSSVQEAATTLETYIAADPFSCPNLEPMEKTDCYGSPYDTSDSFASAFYPI